MKHNTLIFVSVVVALFVSLISAKPLSAAPGSVSVEPAFISTSISSANPEQIETITVKNNFAQPIRLSASPFGVDKRSGQVSATEKLDKALADSLIISDTDFTLKPNQSINLKLLIRNSEKLSPGGHYAAILIKQIDDAGKDIGIQQALGISLYIIKEDGAIRSLTLETPASPVIAFSMPSHIDLTFKNTGNVILIPRASASLGHGSNLYSKGAANEDSLPVAPDNQLVLGVSLTKISSPWLPSKITQTVSYRYDGQDDSMTLTQTFWYIPWQLILVIVATIIICFWQRKRLKKITLKVHKKPKAQKPEPAKKAPPRKIIKDISAGQKVPKKKPRKIEVK